MIEAAPPVNTDSSTQAADAAIFPQIGIRIDGANFSLPTNITPELSGVADQMVADYVGLRAEASAAMQQEGTPQADVDSFIQTTDLLVMGDAPTWQAVQNEAAAWAQNNQEELQDWFTNAEKTIADFAMQHGLQLLLAAGTAKLAYSFIRSKKYKEAAGISALSAAILACAIPFGGTGDIPTPVSEVPTAVFTSTSEATASPATATVEPPPTEGVPDAPTPGPQDKWPTIQQLPVSVSVVTNPIDGSGEDPVDSAQAQYDLFAPKLIAAGYRPVHSMDELKSDTDVFVRYRDSGANLPQGWVLSAETIDGGLWPVLDDDTLAPRPDWATSKVKGFKLIKPDKPLPAGATSAMEQVGNYWTRVYRTSDGQILASLSWNEGKVKWEYAELAEATVAVPTETSPPVEQLPDSCFKIVDKAVEDFPNLDPQHRTVDKAFKDAHLKNASVSSYDYVEPDATLYTFRALVIGTGRVSFDLDGQKVTGLCVIVKGPLGEIYPSLVGVERNNQWIPFASLMDMKGVGVASLDTVETDILQKNIGGILEVRFVRNWPKVEQIGQGRKASDPNGISQDILNGETAAKVFSKSYVAYTTSFASTHGGGYMSSIIPLMTESSVPDKSIDNNPGLWIVNISPDGTMPAKFKLK